MRWQARKALLSTTRTRVTYFRAPDIGNFETVRGDRPKTRGRGRDSVADYCVNLM